MKHDGNSPAVTFEIRQEGERFILVSVVQTDFGTIPAQNFVAECTTREEAEALAKKLEALE